MDLWDKASTWKENKGLSIQWKNKLYFLAPRHQFLVLSNWKFGALPSSSFGLLQQLFFSFFFGFNFSPIILNGLFVNLNFNMCKILHWKPFFRLFHACSSLSLLEFGFLLSYVFNWIVLLFLQDCFIFSPINIPHLNEANT